MTPTATASGATPTGTPVDREGEVSTTNAAVSVTAGDVETVALDQRAGNVTLSRLRFVANASTRGNVSVTASDEPLPDAPAFDVSTETTGLGYFRIDHSVSNDDVANVSLTFRIDRATLEAADASPGEVALYRHTAGRWVAQPTTFLGRSGDVLRFRTTADGYSEWVAGTNRPEMRVAEASVTVEASTAAGGDRALIDARITNDGAADGVYVTRLLLDEAVVDERRVTVPEGGTVQVTFDRSFDDPGTFRVTVNNVTAGVVRVADSGAITVREANASDVPATPASTPTPTASGDDGSLRPTLSGVLLVGVAVGLWVRARSKSE